MYRIRKISICFMVGVIALLCSGSILGQQHNDSLVNVDYYSVMKIGNPVLYSSNPAVVYYMPTNGIASHSVNYYNESGEFRPVSVGKSINEFSFKTNAFKRMKKTVVSGEFTFSKGMVSSINYSNTYDPYRGSPYQFADTAAADNFDKEQYSFLGTMSHRLSDRFVFGAQIEYIAALGSQNIDPRSQNKVSDLNLCAGLIYEFSNELKVGAGILYNYYNEEVDVSVIKNQGAHYLFGLTGLGTYTKHESGSFSRLYKQNEFGWNGLVEYKNHILSMDYSWFNENVYDGRKESGASWAVVKDDSEYRNRTINVDYIYSLGDAIYKHQLNFSSGLSDNVGAEVLQKIVSENTDVYRWATLSKEDKYALRKYSVSAGYMLSKMNSDLLRDYMIGFDVGFNSTDELYYSPDILLSYEHIVSCINGSKYFNFGSSGFEVYGAVLMEKNISKESLFPFRTFITDNIIVPDFIYFSSGYYQLNTRLTYDFRLKGKGRLFASSDFTYIGSYEYNSSERFCALFTLGAMF